MEREKREDRDYAVNRSYLLSLLIVARSLSNNIYIYIIGKVITDRTMLDSSSVAESCAGKKKPMQPLRGTKRPR